METVFEGGEQEIRLTDIVIGERHREIVEDAALDELAESIKTVGLLNPITVDKTRRLIAGRRRLQAHLKLGRETILARVLPLDGLERELAEIDENLARAELTELEQCNHLARRKEIYLELHPETRRGGDRRSEDFKSQHPASGPKSFVEETAALTGKSASTIKEKVSVGERLTYAAKAQLTGTPIANNRSHLKALAAMPPEEQEAAAANIASGAATNVAEVVGTPAPSQRRSRSGTVRPPNNNLGDRPMGLTLQLTHNIDAMAELMWDFFRPEEVRQLISDWTRRLPDFDRASITVDRMARVLAFADVLRTELTTIERRALVELLLCDMETAAA